MGGGQPPLSGGVWGGRPPGEAELWSGSTTSSRAS
jgi:hypothetical protein